MKINTDNETIAENKVLILYILNTIEKPITNNALYELVISIQDINYFYFQQFILDLLENKYISELKEDERSELVYSITTVGKQTLELTKDMIPGIIKLKIDNTLNKKENKEKLCRDIYECMAKRSLNNDYEYIKYKEKL